MSAIQDPRDHRRLIRVAAVAAMIAAPLLLSGCFPKPIDVSGATRLDVPSEEPEVDVEVEETTVPAGSLSFEEGAALTASTTAEWADGLMFDDDWTLTSPDDGNGNWGYTSADGSCTVAFWQGLIGDVDTSSGDDRVVSDEMLAVLLGTTVDQISPYAFDDEFSYQVTGNEEAQNRSIVGDDGTVKWMMSARALAQPGLGFTTTIDCTGGADPEEVLDEVNELSAIIVLP